MSHSLQPVLGNIFEFHNCLNLFSAPIGLITCSSKKCNARVKFQMKIRKIISFSKIKKHSELNHAKLLLCERTTKKCTKIYNALAQPLCCTLSLLFGGVFTAFAVVVWLNSLIRLQMGWPTHSEFVPVLSVDPHGRLVHRRFPSEICPPGARFSNVPVTKGARNHILKSKFQQK